MPVTLSRTHLLKKISRVALEKADLSDGLVTLIYA